MSRVTNSTHWWQKKCSSERAERNKIKVLILLKSYNKYFSWYLQGVDRTDFPESDLIGSHISSNIIYTFNFNLHKQLVTIREWWDLIDHFRRKKELIVFQMNIYFQFFLHSHFWHLQSHSMEIWSIFVERRVWYWFRFHSCHIFFYNHILDIHNRILWYRFHSYHIYFYGHILDLHNRILWSADQSSSEVDLDKNSTHVIFISIITFWTFTIALYGNLINLCRKTNSILIQIPLMSYSFL